MREIKFRAWVSEFSNDNHTMIDDFVFVNEDNHFMAEDLVNKRPCVGGIHAIMQFIGLKDKNEKDIYEGDCVLFENNDLIHVVEYYKDGFILKSVDGKVRIFNINNRYINVIGNIYENPEFLTSGGKI